MRIVDKKKFLRMIIIVLGIIIVLSFYFTTFSYSKGEIKTKTIYISSGETLWAIAKEEQSTNTYYEDKDVRDIISEIKKINNLESNSNIQVGQKLLVNTF